MEGALEAVDSGGTVSGSAEALKEAEEGVREGWPRLGHGCGERRVQFKIQHGLQK